MIILNRNGTTQNTYLKHATQHDWWKPETNGKSNTQIMRELGNRPVCPRCETLAMRHTAKDWAKCPKCGWEGRTISLDEMLTNQMYK